MSEEKTRVRLPDHEIRAFPMLGHPNGPWLRLAFDDVGLTRLEAEIRSARRMMNERPTGWLTFGFKCIIAIEEVKPVAEAAS